MHHLYCSLYLHIHSQVFFLLATWGQQKQAVNKLLLKAVRVQLVVGAPHL